MKKIIISTTVIVIVFITVFFFKNKIINVNNEIFNNQNMNTIVLCDKNFKVSPVYIDNKDISKDILDYVFLYKNYCSYDQKLGSGLYMEMSTDTIKNTSLDVTFNGISSNVMINGLNDLYIDGNNVGNLKDGKEGVYKNIKNYIPMNIEMGVVNFCDKNFIVNQAIVNDKNITKDILSLLKRKEDPCKNDKIQSTLKISYLRIDSYENANFMLIHNGISHSISYNENTNIISLINEYDGSIIDSVEIK